MQLIDGKAISEQVKQEIAAEVAEIVANGGKRPHLAAILVGHDGGSETYVAAKVKACEACGFTSQEQRGVYKCPVCGTQMKIHREERRGGLTNTSGKILIYFLECIIILPICLVFLNVFGIIVFIIIYCFQSCLHCSIISKVICSIIYFIKSSTHLTFIISI